VEYTSDKRFGKPSTGNDNDDDDDDGDNSEDYNAIKREAHDEGIIDEVAKEITKMAAKKEPPV
jgi:hypothetical protein